MSTNRWDRLRKRRIRAISRTTERGLWCEGRMWTGPYYGARCIHPATGYQPLNDIYVCGIHARAYTHVEPIALTAGPPQAAP